jgi:hypothetical protein
MCFCASASFAASGGLAIIGAASVIQAQRKDRLIAFIPVLFAIQQFIEGSQWLAMHPSSTSILLGYAYLCFAFLLWPVYLPFAVLSIEKNLRIQRLLRWCLYSGALISGTLLFILLLQPLSIELLPKGILYNIFVPFEMLGGLFYIIVACGSLFLSSSSFLRWFGLAGAFSAFVSWWLFQGTFTSVWCFFAAVLSLPVYLYVTSENKKQLTKTGRKAQNSSIKR